MTETKDTGLRRFIGWFCIAIVVVALDQATKWAMSAKRSSPMLEIGDDRFADIDRQG